MTIKNDLYDIRSAQTVTHYKEVLVKNTESEVSDAINVYFLGCDCAFTMQICKLMLMILFSYRFEDLTECKQHKIISANQLKNVIYQKFMKWKISKLI